MKKRTNLSNFGRQQFIMYVRLKKKDKYCILLNLVFTGVWVSNSETVIEEIINILT